jgi:hypothetical protein
MSPRIRVSGDGRRETVYSDETYRERMRSASGVGDWDVFLEKTDTDLVLVERGSAVYYLMRLKPGWSMAYTDALCGLLVRDGSPFRESLARTRLPEIRADGGGIWFP